MKFNKVKMVEHIRNLNPQCPVCENAEWTLDNELVDIIYHNTGLSLAATKVQLTCSTCGYTLFLDPHIANAIEEEVEEE